jgi:hypothetical protein
MDRLPIRRADNMESIQASTSATLTVTASDDFRCLVNSSAIRLYFFTDFSGIGFEPCPAFRLVA